MANERTEVSVVWPGVDEVPVQPANQFLGQILRLNTGAPDEFLLVVGHISPPVVLGSPEEQQAMARALGAVGVKTLARVTMTIGRARELRDLLDRQLKSIDEDEEGVQS